MTTHKPVTEADLAAAVLAMLDVPFTLTAESAARDAERLGMARADLRRLALAALPEPEPTAREDGPEPPRHHHQSFAARDACESCVAAMTRARAVANVAEAKRTIREDWPEWLRSNRDAVHQQPTRHVHSFDCDETCPVHPDFAHPEAACQRCGGPNPVWSAPNDLWNAVMGTADNPRGEGVIVCWSCFLSASREGTDREPTAREALRRAYMDLLAYGQHMTGEVKVQLWEDEKKFGHRRPGEPCKCGLDAALIALETALKRTDR